MRGAVANMVVVAGLVGVLGAAGVMSGCGDSGKHAGTALPDPVEPESATTRARADKAKDDKANPFADSAIDLQAAFDQMKSKDAARIGDDPASPASGTRAAASRRAPTSAAGSSDRDGGGIGANTPASVPESGEGGAQAAPKSKPAARATDKAPAQRKADAVRELAAQIKPDFSAAGEPMRAAMPLIGLDVIAPASTAADLDMVLRGVTPEQQRTIRAARDVVRSMAADPDLARADPQSLARLLREKADGLGGAVATDKLAIGAAALCQRVEGFGRFTPLGTTAFLAGKPAAMILYTEVENFTQSHPGDAPTAAHPEQGADTWQVELGQTVKLYLDSDGSEQVVFQESVVRDAAASRRHDFFLVQRIDLPRTLSVGNYNLKVSVRDMPSGALAERTIPIRVIADASALRPERRAEVSAPSTGPRRQVAGAEK